MTELKQALDEYVKDRMPETMVLAKVTYVLDDGPWCNATDAVGNEYSEIRLQPQLLNGSESYMLPKVGSWIVVGSLRGTTEYVCLMIGEFDIIRQATGGTLFRQTANGFVMKKNTETLAGLVGELIAAIKLLTVTCAAPGSPSSPPINVAVFTALETRFNDLLKTG